MSAKPFLHDVQTLQLRVRRHLDDGAGTTCADMGRETILRLLNASLATELVCVLRYRRYHFFARQCRSDEAAAQFIAHTSEEQDHVDQIAERIVQLGGEPDFSQDGLVSQDHAGAGEGLSLLDLIKEDIVAECIAMDSYREIVSYLQHRDPATHRMMAGILVTEEKHAREMAGLLEGVAA